MTVVYLAVIGGWEVGPESMALAREVGREVARKGRGAHLRRPGRGDGRRGPGGDGGRRGEPGHPAGCGPQPGQPLSDLHHPHQSGPRPQRHYRPSADALIAVDGDYGTISEAAIALKLGKPVVALRADWELRGLQRAADCQGSRGFGLVGVGERIRD